jgi:hypothetical protein
MRRIFSVLAASSVLLVSAGCSDDASNDGSAPLDGSAGSGGGGTGDQPTSEIPAHCDPIDPNYCGFPFPNSFYTSEDASSPTGIRLAFDSNVLPRSSKDTETSAEELNRLDGFSPGVPMMTLMPGATLNGLPPHSNIDDSLAADSPTIIINAETGARVAHFVELDQDRAGGKLVGGALLIRPVVRLDDATRYIVAIRNVKGAAGETLPTSETFQALIDGVAIGHARTEARRDHFEDIFQKLETAGITKTGLQLAWDFTTASKEGTTGALLHMRDEALKLIDEANAPLYTIINVTPDPDDHLAFEIEGTISVPLYLDEDKAGATLLFGEDGKPTINEETPWHDVPFFMGIPKSATPETPAKLVLYGHGLLGSREEVHWSGHPVFMNNYNYSFFSTNLVGMSDDGDEVFIGGVLASGEFHNLARMFDRLHQGSLNYLALMRIISTRFVNDETYGALLSSDASERYYHGISQGGIFGGVLMSVTTDITRGVLGVMGQPYSTLLDRSVDFDPFKGILRIGYPNRLDQLLLLNVAQGQWDRVEPNGYTPYIINGDLPNTPAHSVLMRSALGDHQVTTIAAQVMARSVGVKHLESGQRALWGLDAVTEAEPGQSAYIEYDFGLPEDPMCNTPQRACDDPHDKVRRLTESRDQMDHFFRTGEIKNFCEGGVCSFPDLGGCPGEAEVLECAAESTWAP